jgi:opacity protein-like surface antigen
MSHLRFVFLAGAAAAAMCASAEAAVLVPVPAAPNSTATTAFGINDAFQISGSYIGKDDGIEHAFFGTLDGNYISFDAGDGGSEARAINNNGTIVGFSNSQNGITADQPIFERMPGGRLLVLNGVFGRAQGIDNAKSRFAGTRWDFGEHEAVAFVGRRGQYRHDALIPQEHQASEANGINSDGVVVGDYFMPPTHGFIGTGSKMQIVDYPSSKAAATMMEGINDAGQAVGQWQDNHGNTHSFVLEIATATFTDILVSGASNVFAWNINNQGGVVVSSNVGSFVWCKKARQCPSGGATVAAPTHKARPFSFLKD